MAIGPFAGQGQPAEDTGAELDEALLDEQAGEGEDTGADVAGGQEDPIIEFDGKQYKASDLRNYIKGGMLERDYRTKTTALAREKEQMGELRQAAEAWQTIQQHPELMQALGTTIAQLLQGGAPGLQGQGQVPQGDQVPGEQQNPYETRLRQMEGALGSALGAFDQRFQDYNKYLWDQYHANRESYAHGQIQQLQQKYPFLVADEVVAAYRDNDNFDLEEIAKTSNEYWQQWYQERQAANLQKRKENAAARVAVPGAKAGGPAVQTKQPVEWEDAMKSALERLKKVGTPVT